ncbi:MAG: A/G-specific adenine glycosylase [Pirellulales bacterium]|nr:A/G-specific adenine glycosylase [Pirellulales bacterium]
MNDPLSLSARQRTAFRKKLLAWFAEHARDLPWRRSRDPYRVWLSEVMLQQTTVAAVKPYFERFTAAFPQVQDLAAADEQQVLRMWEGLGYYRRARGLLAAAKKLVAEFDGAFPRDVPTLMSLPGVGRYTAGAVASIAFDAKAPIVEANTIRVLSRLVGYREDPMRTAGQKLLWHVAEELLPDSDVARFNQGMMELGSLVCTPLAPKCDACPVAAYCEANRLGLQHIIPATTRKQEFTAVREAAVIVRQNGSVLMRQCPTGERWEGLWDFPRFTIDAEGPLFVAEELAKKVAEQTGVTVQPGPLVKTLKHGVTRYRITLECYEATRSGGRVRSTAERPVRWTPLAELADLPLSATGRKLAAFVAEKVSRSGAEGPEKKRRV